MNEIKTQNQRLDYLVEEFKRDSVQYTDLETPKDTEGKRRILRSLMNIRMPGKMNEAVLAVQDDYLRERIRENGIVDHCFQRSGFDKKRLFYTQGDYGLLQSSNPHGASAHKTYENEEIMRKIILAQGFEIGEDNELIIPEGREISMRIPTELIPYCPDDGEPMTTNLRSDDKFVEDEGWHQAAERYSVFLRRHENLKVLFLEAAVGMNTPGIIKFQFWKIVNQWPDATYACLNYGEAYAPDEIIDRSICINGDIREILMKL